jgi:plasmid stabilization system protein ParE
MRRHVRPAFYLDVAQQELWLLEHAGAEIADRWHEALWKTIEFLQRHPLIGRERRDLKHTGIRSWRIKDFGRWLIFYGVRDDILVLYRVASGTMDLAELSFK